MKNTVRIAGFAALVAAAALFAGCNNDKQASNDAAMNAEAKACSKGDACCQKGAEAKAEVKKAGCCGGEAHAK